MKILLDTSVCIDYLRRKPATLEKLLAFKARDVLIPVMLSPSWSMGFISPSTARRNGSGLQR